MNFTSVSAKHLFIVGFLSFTLGAQASDVETENTWCNGQSKRDVFAEYFPTAQPRANAFGQYYPNGQVVQNVFGTYYPNGQVIQNVFGTYYPNGQITKNVFGAYYPNGQVTQNVFGCYQADGSPRNSCADVIRGSFRVADYRMRFQMDVATGAVSHLSFRNAQSYGPSKTIRTRFELNQSGDGPLIKNFTAVCRTQTPGGDSDWEIDSN